MYMTILFTGGTIGSAEADGIRHTDENSVRELLDAYAARYGAENWRIRALDFKLSENNGGARITEIVEAAAEALEDDIDGIVITHGTDTLQYTAAALRYALGAKVKPVVLVSSSDPVGDPDTNAIYNLRAAVNFIRMKGTGVKVAYIASEACKRLSKSGIREPENCIFEPDRMIAHEPYSDVFRIADRACGYPEDGAYRKGVRLKDGEVLRLKVYPGMLYPTELANGVRAVILESYHSGTVRTDGEDLKKFLAYAAERGITVYLAGAMPHDVRYDGSEDLAGLGMVLLDNYAPIAAYVKVWYDLAKEERN